MQWLQVRLGSTTDESTEGRIFWDKEVEVESLGYAFMMS